MIFTIVGRQTVGGRDYQEDSWRVRSFSGQDVSVEAGSAEGVTLRDGCLVVLADGAGGQKGGGVASIVVADVLTDSFFDHLELGPQQAFSQALRDIALALEDRKGLDLELSNMASTIVAGFFDADGGRATLVSVGDSLALRLRDGELHVLNAEHNFGIDLDEMAFVDCQEASWDLAAHHPSRAAISAALTGDPGHTTDHHETPLLARDMVMFASDGLLVPLTHEHVRRFGTRLITQGHSVEVAPKLIDAVDQLGRRRNKNLHDNATVVTVYMQESPEGAKA
jgi:serine/threonine protein phosphatase PrpC